MNRTGRNRMSLHEGRGFTVLEVLVVVVIILIVAGMAAPRMLQMSDQWKLQSSAQAYAGLLQVARSRAVQDDVPYQVLTDTISGTPVAFVDLNGDGKFTPGGAAPEPGLLLANPITVSDSNVPTGFNTVTLLNIIPLHDATSPMVTPNGTARAGIAFNERGLPCQRLAAGGNCTNNITGAGLPPQVAWVTYFQYALRNGGTAYAAISVTPAGRIKTWTYQSSGNGGGTWR